VLNVAKILARDMNLNLISTLRSLGGGGLLGGGAAALAYLFKPSLFPAASSVDVVASVGGLLGAGVHYYLAAAVDWILFRPLIKFCRVYGGIVLGLPLFPFMNKGQREQILRTSVNELARPADDRPALTLPASRQKKSAGTK